MIVCFFDFETNGLDIEKNQPTEVGAVKYRYENKTWTPLLEYSAFLHDETYPKQPDYIVELTGITDGLLREQGERPEIVFKKIIAFLGDVDLMVAHEAKFDRSMLEHNLAKMGLPVPQKEWLCTKRNFLWPEKYSCHRLTHLALEHFIEFRMRDMHRATADCGLLQKLMALYDFDEAIKYAREPFVVVKAKTAAPWVDGGIQRDIAHAKLKMSWERVEGELIAPKHWVKKVKVSQVEKMKQVVAASQSPFEIITEGVL